MGAGSEPTWSVWCSGVLSEMPLRPKMFIFLLTPLLSCQWKCSWLIWAMKAVAMLLAYCVENMPRRGFAKEKGVGWRFSACLMSSVGCLLFFKPGHLIWTMSLSGQSWPGKVQVPGTHLWEGKGHSGWIFWHSSVRILWQKLIANSL